jgi:hypothetical protein
MPVHEALECSAEGGNNIVKGCRHGDTEKGFLVLSLIVRPSLPGRLWVLHATLNASLLIFSLREKLPIDKFILSMGTNAIRNKY